MTINPLRITCRNQIPAAPGAVVYWMSRDQRVADNWALLHAQSLALARQAPLAVVFTLADSFLGATLRQFDFMLRGLAGVARRLEELSNTGTPYLLKLVVVDIVRNFILTKLRIFNTI